MSRLQALLDGPNKPTLVSFSVDPVFDTPEVLSAYALKHKAEPGWFFLTGEPAAIYRLIEGGFRLPVEPVADPSRLAAGELFIHTSRFVLVDRKGHMRAVIDSERPDFFEEVQRLVGLLASSD
jgi:protein SCO1/2